MKGSKCSGIVRTGTVAVLVAALAGCAGNAPSRETGGMVIGGGLGALAGSQFGGGKGKIAAAVIGTMIGAAIGGSVGRTMDEVDRLKANQALESVRTGTSASWQNPDTGHQYSVTPTRTFEREGTPCREYAMEARIGGRPEQVYGTACRQADGSWKTIN